MSDSTDLMVSDTFLLICRAQRNGGNDRTSSRIWVRPNVDRTSAKAVKFVFVELPEAFKRGISVNG
jgi:hypothetical protein